MMTKRHISFLAISMLTLMSSIDAAQIKYVLTSSQASPSISYPTALHLSLDSQGQADWQHRLFQNPIETNLGQIQFSQSQTQITTHQQQKELFAAISDNKQIQQSTQIVANTPLGFNKTQSIRYTSPKLSGFSTQLSYQFEPSISKQHQIKQQQLIAQASYDNGAYVMQAGYSQAYEFDSELNTHALNWGLAKRLHQGEAKVVAKLKLFNDGLGVSEKQFMTYTMEGSFDFGANSLQAQYTHKTPGINELASDSFGLGLSRHLGKKTSAYVSYTQRINADDKADLIQFNDKKDSDKGISMGLIHQF